MDMHMPVMGGLEATKAIRQMNGFSNIPIVAISADAFIQQQRKALEAGVNEYITKPVDLKKLIPVLSRYLIPAEVQEPTKEENTKMPDKAQTALKDAIGTLAKIPAFKLNKMLEQIKTIRKIVHRYGSPYSTILTELEDAVFDNDTEQIKGLLKKITLE